MTYKTKNVLPYPYYANTANNSNVWENGGITYTLLENGYVHVQGTVTAFSAMFLRYNYDDVLRDGATYTLGLFVKEGNSAGLAMAAAIKDKATGTNKYIANNTNPTFTVNKELYEYSWIRLNVPTVGTEINCVVGPQIEEGSATTEYSPWFEGLRHSPVTEIKSVGANEIINSLAIPKEVQALDGYGWGIPDVSYNKVEWKPDEGIKRFLKTIYRHVITGKEGDWLLGSFNGIQQFYSVTLSNIVEQTPNTRLLCADFTNIPNLNQYGNAYVTSDGGGSLRFCVDPAQCNGVDEWVAYLQKRFEEGNPLVFLYSASTAEVTDISHLLSDDNFINVEGAGAIEFVNEHSQAVPSSITYLLKEGSVV